jgi:hypothetical protein
VKYFKKVLTLSRTSFMMDYMMYERMTDGKRDENKSSRGIDMVHTVCYPLMEGRDAMGTQSGNLTYGQAVDVQSILAGPRKTRKGKGRTKMANEETNVNTEANDQEATAEAVAVDNVKRIQKTVFDLGTFKNVTLYKDVEQPKKPADLREAQAMVGGSTEALLNLIYTGLVAKTNEDAQKVIDGFHFCTADYPLDPNKRPALEGEYKGNYAEGEKKAMINAAVLSMAKMMGYATGNSAEVNEKYREQAMEIIRANPVMLKSLQG